MFSVNGILLLEDIVATLSQKRGWDFLFLNSLIIGWLESNIFFLNEAHKAKFLSPDIQNELIELAGEEVLSSILSRARIANKMCRRIEY